MTLEQRSSRFGAGAYNGITAVGGLVIAYKLETGEAESVPATHKVITEATIRGAMKDAPLQTQ